MLLKSLTLTDFRNFASQEVEFGPAFTVLIGQNGAGKTNVLEALYLISTLRSFRASDMAALIRHEQPAANVELVADDPTLGVATRLSVLLERRGNGARRTATADGKTIRRAADFYGRVRAVLFTPEDLGVLRGSPQGRRQFLDRVVFARDRAHISDTNAYDKLVRSRNHVLRQDPAAVPMREDLLDSYDAGLADVGARIWSRRIEAIDAVREQFVVGFARIHGATPVASLTYVSKLGAVAASDRAETLRDGLRSRRRDDDIRGATTVGPHRDDFQVDLGGQPAATFASQGQARALVLAFKLAELRAAHALLGAPPLLLLDDVSSELDERRSAKLFETLADQAGQCILTTTARHFVTLPDGVERRMLMVDAGIVQPRDPGA